MALRSTVIAGINFAAMLLSIPVIAAGICLATQADNSCVKLLQWPVIAIGILIFLVGLDGFIGAFWRLPSLLIFYLVAMLLMILVLAGLVVFIFAVTGGGSGRSAPNRVYREYRLEDYSGWLSRRVDGSEKWARIRACLSSTAICAELNQTYSLPQDFFYARLNPLQSGCCKPPTECGYTFVNPIYWINPISGQADSDCAQWSNDPAELCYSCDSCKAGLAANLSSEWRRADIILLFALAALIFVYFASCYVFRAAKTDKLFSQYRQGYSHS
ncbi:Protein TORNADO 2 [Platanthera guangdongensis]|uniref:Protein TORNADO 2 n=1 Tax=Platanthera guangdongensis TaxID=2320717 RepID=A0ABR2LQ17_9ASPA